MPIKFRCQHCKQLLGIAHSKAGSLVDCPTCGRTLRVPNLDGTVDPAPVLGLNLADAGLRRALDELGQIGQTEDETQDSRPLPPDLAAKVAPQVSGKEPADLPSHKVDHDSRDDAGRPNPEHLAPLLPPVKPSPSWTDGNAQRVIAQSSFLDSEDLNPSMSESLSSALPPSHAGIPRIGINRAPAAKAEMIALAPLPSQRAMDPAIGGQQASLELKSVGGVQQEGSEHQRGSTGAEEDVLAGLARAPAGKPRQAGDANHISARSTSRDPVTRHRTLWIVGLISFALGISVGFGIGKWTSPQVTRVSPALASDAGITPSDQQGATRVVGHISYRTAHGRLQPDSGARIIGIPIAPLPNQRSNAEVSDAGDSGDGASNNRPGEAGMLDQAANRSSSETNASNGKSESEKLVPVTAKLPVVGFRPADAVPEQEAAAKLLAAISGVEATVDESGHFQLELPHAGEFQLIVLSRFQGRNVDQPWSKLAESTLRARFDRPEQLVGKLAFHVATLQHEGTGAVRWNHVFETE